jgi:hypothetical protein
MSKPRHILLALGLALGTLAAAGAEPTISKEYQIKAAFLYNFTKFVEWPPERFASADAPIVIGVIGKHDLKDELATLVRDRKVNGRPITVVQLRSVSEIAGTHVVFITAGEESRLDPLGGIWPPGVLSVGESPRFAEMGAVNFTKSGDKVRFEIDVSLAERGGLKISAQLQKLASAVRRKK